MIRVFLATTLRPVAALLLVISISTSSASADDRNWIALHIWDSFYPMTEDRSLPENLNSLEVMYNYFHKRVLRLDIEKFFWKTNPFGVRSREGHYAVWIHLSDRYLASHPINRAAIGEHTFLYRTRNNDIFTGWSGSANMAALLREGIRGLGRPVVDADGKATWVMNAATEMYDMGEADYEGGWFMNDDQAERVIAALLEYPGRVKGYSFLGIVADRDDHAYEPQGAQLMNGYNCGDFAFYLLEKGGVIPRAETEALKIKLWYPDRYFDHPLPVSRLGQQGTDWLNQHPDATGIPGNVFTSIAWADLLFGRYGVEFFYKQPVFSETWRGELRYLPARVWDQANAINWLRRRNGFRSKGVRTEMFALAARNIPITDPYRHVQPTRENSWVLSDEYLDYQQKGANLEYRKLRRNGIVGGMRDHFRRHVDRFKIHLQ
jgi:hypothetical protein